MTREALLVELALLPPRWSFFVADPNRWLYLGRDGQADIYFHWTVHQVGPNGRVYLLQDGSLHSHFVQRARLLANKVA